MAVGHVHNEKYILRVKKIRLDHVKPDQLLIYTDTQHLISFLVYVML